MSHEDVLTEIRSHFSSALEVFFGINSDTNDELPSYGTPESRAAGLLEKLRPKIPARLVGQPYDSKVLERGNWTFTLKDRF